MFGIENGLWEKSIFFSSSFHSYIGKSTIQQNSKRSLAIRPSSSPTLVRAGPANLHELLRLAGDEEHRVADAEPELIGDLLRCAPARCSWRAGPRRPPRPRARRCSRAPAGPRAAPRRSCGRRTRGCRPSAPGSPRPRPWDPAAIMPAKTLKPEPRKASVTFCISIGLRRSGLSVPYFAHRRRRRGCSGNFGVTGLPSANSSNTPRITGSTASNTSSWVTKLISRSSW